MYNLTNPLQYLKDGEEANFQELGGYAYNLDITRANPVFSAGGDRVQYTLYVSGVFSAELSASMLAPSDEIFSMNAAYLSVLGRAKSEAVLLLSATCSPTQLGVLSNSQVRVCRTEEINTDAVCRCCSPTPLENSTTCRDIASTASQAGGLISYLGMVDGGMQLDSSPSAFPLSSGTFSPLVVKKTVNDLLLGMPSALLGQFQYKGGQDTDRSRIANTTADIVEACSVLGYCPTYTELMAQVAQANNFNEVIGLIKSLNCAGVIPDTAGLETAGIPHSRALELRYLEGANCRPYTATLAAAGLVSATSGQGSVYTCGGEAGTQLPCCLSSFTIPGMGSGAGLGCLLWVPGTLVTRQTYSEDEAHRYLTPSPVNEVCVKDEGCLTCR